MRKINWFNILIPALILLFIGFRVENEYYIGVIIFIMINALNVTGFNILLGYTGIISIGQAAFFGIGAYVTGLLSVHYDISPFIALPAGMVVSFVMAFIVAWPVLKLSGHYLAMATLGLGMIFNIVMNEMDFLTGGPSGLVGIGDLQIFGFIPFSEKDFFLILSVIFIICIFLFELFDKSFLHYKLKFIKSSETASASYGINTAMTKVFVFAAVASFTAFNGGIYAYYTHFISPVSFSLKYSVELVAMATVGGLGYISGGIIGAVMLGLIPVVFANVEEYEMIIYGCFLAVSVMFFPGGITGTITWLVKKNAKN